MGVASVSACRKKTQRSVLSRPAAAALEIGTDTDATATPPGSRFAGARLESLPIGEREGAIQHRLEVAALDAATGTGGIRQLVTSEQIAPPQGNAIHAELRRRQVDDALDVIGGFRAPGAAVGIRGRGVGEGGAGRKVQRRNAVGASLGTRAAAGAGEGTHGQ
jgi:hypothetical protein